MPLLIYSVDSTVNILLVQYLHVMSDVATLCLGGSAQVVLLMMGFSIIDGLRVSVATAALICWLLLTFSDAYQRKMRRLRAWFNIPNRVFLVPYSPRSTSNEVFISSLIGCTIPYRTCSPDWFIGESFDQPPLFSKQRQFRYNLRLPCWGLYCRVSRSCRTSLVIGKTRRYFRVLTSVQTHKYVYLRPNGLCNFDKRLRIDLMIYCIHGKLFKPFLTQRRVELVVKILEETEDDQLIEEVFPHNRRFKKSPNPNFLIFFKSVFA